MRLDDDWQERGFPQLVEALRKWCEGTQCPRIAIGVGSLEGMTEEMIGHFKPNKEMGNPTPVFIVNQGNTNQSIVKNQRGS